MKRKVVILELMRTKMDIMNSVFKSKAATNARTQSEIIIPRKHTDSSWAGLKNGISQAASL